MLGALSTNLAQGMTPGTGCAAMFPDEEVLAYHSLINL